MRAAMERDDVMVVAYNDPFIDPEYAAYMLKYDSVHGRFKGTVEYDGDGLVINGNKVKGFQCMNVSAAENFCFPSMDLNNHRPGISRPITALAPAVFSELKQKGGIH
jgi:hypothetical protein